MTKQDDTNFGESRRIAALNELILRSIVDHAVVTLDADGLITSWNEGAERILGWKEEEIIGRSVDVFFTERDTAQNRSETEMQLALENGRAEDVRWHVRKDGQRFWGSGLMMPLISETDADGSAIQDPGKIDGFVKIFRDRTAERQANRRMERLQDRASLAMRQTGTVGVYDLDLREDLIVADKTSAVMHSVDPDVAESGATTEAFFHGILPEDQAEVKRAIAAVFDEGKNLDVIYRATSAEPRPRWLHSQGSVQFDEDDRPVRLTGIVVDITDQREFARMQDARLSFAEKVRDMQDITAIAELASRVIGKTLYATRAGHGYIGADGDTIDIPADWHDPGCHSLVGQHKYSDFGSFVSALQEGKNVVMSDVETDHRVDNPEGLADMAVRSLVNLPLMEKGRLKAVLYVADIQPREWTEAEITFLRGIFDRTYAAMDRVWYEGERNLLANELAHRMTNILTIAQVVVAQSLRQKPGLEEERNSIAARLNALAGAQDVLTKAKNRDADIRNVIDATLAPHRPEPGRIVIDGPSLPLKSQQVLGLSLALHELATNAAKYGALSNESGRVRIEWTLRDTSFAFQWTEVGGPEVSAPEDRGFGSTILDRLVGNYFEGTSRLVFESDGVVFSIKGSLD